MQNIGRCQADAASTTSGDGNFAFELLRPASLLLNRSLNITKSDGGLNMDSTLRIEELRICPKGYSFHEYSGSPEMNYGSLMAGDSQPLWPSPLRAVGGLYRNRQKSYASAPKDQLSQFRLMRY